MNAQNQNILLEVILVALKGYIITPKRKRKRKEDPEEVWSEGKINFSYLLGQAIRQWQIPPKNWHTSKNAHIVWKMITKQETIPHYQYKEVFTPNVAYSIPRFEGTTRDFGKVELKELQKDTKYVFNDIFIAEHTVPVADIRDALEEYYKDNSGKISDDKLKDGIITILNAMHLTQMLKIEDRRIKNSSKRLKQICPNGMKGYDYLIKSNSKKVYKDVTTKYYKKLSFAKKKNFNDSDYKAKIESFFSCNNGIIPDWAQALNLDKPYKIEIAVKEIL